MTLAKTSSPQQTMATCRVPPSKGGAKRGNFVGEETSGCASEPALHHTPSPLQNPYAAGPAALHRACTQSARRGPLPYLFRTGNSPPQPGQPQGCHPYRHEGRVALRVKGLQPPVESPARNSTPKQSPRRGYTAPSPGQRPGTKSIPLQKHALKGHHSCAALTGLCIRHENLLPRAMPWALSCKSPSG